MQFQVDIDTFSKINHAIRRANILADVGNAIDVVIIPGLGARILRISPWGYQFKTKKKNHDYLDTDARRVEVNMLWPFNTNRDWRKEVYLTDDDKEYISEMFGVRNLSTLTNVEIDQLVLSAQNGNERARRIIEFLVLKDLLKLEFIEKK